MKYVTNITDTGSFVYSNVDTDKIFEDVEAHITVFDINSFKTYLATKQLKEDKKVVFSPKVGCYVSEKQLSFASSENQKRFLKIFGSNNFPYKLIDYCYAANNSMNLFNNLKHSYLKTVAPKLGFTLSDYMPYTFGIEFETACGFIPEDDCFYYGLIPLRDGSISGVEYSTVVLEGNSGMNLLCKQVELLNQYTLFNKECALHIHFGGFPKDPEKILRLNNIFAWLETSEEFFKIIPTATFHTSLYKKNKKDYCVENKYYTTFDDLFCSITGEHYMGSLTQPHPNDINRTAKWNIKSRYVGCNLVNMCCYGNPKTVEFRFLRPTRNVNIIFFWLYILNAILKYAESTDRDISSVLTLSEVLDAVYPIDIYLNLMKAIEDLTIIRQNQYAIGDICNNAFYLENNFYLPGNLIYKDYGRIQECNVRDAEKLFK